VLNAKKYMAISRIQKIWDQENKDGEQGTLLIPELY
jgi:hypothetical protein